MDNLKFSRTPVNRNNDSIQSKTLNIGNDFLQSKSELVLEVLSAVLPDEATYIINPYHEGFAEVKLVSIKRIERVFEAN
jgi:hypothetical protein